MATFVSISGDALNALKDVYRRHLSVPERLASQECVACTKAIADDRWQTEPGRRELERTGVCEQCWDTIHGPGVSDTAAQQQCDRLSISGVETCRQWIMFSKVREVARMSSEHGRLAWELILGRRQLPPAT